MGGQVSRESQRRDEEQKGMGSTRIAHRTGVLFHNKKISLFCISLAPGTWIDTIDTILT